MDYFVKRLQPLAPAEKSDEPKEPGCINEEKPASPDETNEPSRPQKRASLKKPSSRRQETADEEQNRLAHVLGWRSHVKRVADSHNPKL